jgi:hypothetical protein
MVIKSNGGRWPLGPGATILLVLVIFSSAVIIVLALSNMGNEQLPTVLAFLGVLVTAAISLLGLLLKDLAEKRIEKDKSLAEKRLERERKSDGERLRLDAAMRAGALLADSDSSPATPGTMASGLLALTRLGHCELAVALLVDLWSDDEFEANRRRIHSEAHMSSEHMIPALSPGGHKRGPRVSTETAILTISAALQSDEPNAPLVAAELLCRNAQRLDACQSLHWPSAVDGRWRSDVSQKTKLLLVDALVTMTITSPPNENALRSLAVRLYGIWKYDKDVNVKGCIANLIDTIIPKLEKCRYKEFVEGPETVPLTELQKAARDKKDKSDHYLNVLMIDRCVKLKEWSDDCTNTYSLRCGALGDGMRHGAEHPGLRSHV